MLNRRIVHIGHFPVDVVLQLLCKFGVGFLPFGDALFALGHYFAKFIGALLVKLGHFGEHSPRVGHVAAQVIYCLFVASARFAQRLAVSAALALKVLAVGGDTAASHNGVPYNERGALCLCLCHLNGIGNCKRVAAVDFDHVPVPSFVLHCGVLVAHFVAVGRKLHFIAVVEHYEIAQTQMSGYAGGLLRNSFLNASVADECIRLVGKHFAEVGGKEALCYGATHCHRLALAKWARCVLYAVGWIKLGVAGRDAAQAAECLDVVEGVFAAQKQYAVKHWRHVSRIKEKPVANEPLRVVRVVYKIT